MFFLLLNYVKPLEEIDQHLEAHKRYLAHLYEQGKIVLSGRKQPRTGGVMLACAQSRDEVFKFIELDPFHVHGFAHYDVIEFLPTQASEDLKSLLGR